MKREIFVFLLIALLFFSADAQKKEQCTISGRIIDDYNNPVINSYIQWYPEYGGEIHFNTYFSKSDENGKFEYTESCPIGILTLYVTSSLNQKNYTPLLPPFAYGSKLAKQIKGLPVIKNEKGDLDLGDVKVQVYYSTAKIRFADESGANLFSEKKDWQNAVIRFRDKNGKFYGEDRFLSNEIEKFVRIEESSIIADLPEGDWKIEIRLNTDKKEWLKPDKFVSIKRSETKTEVSLIMAKKNN